MLAFMEPKGLAEYERLIQNQLQKDLYNYQQSVSSIPFPLKELFKNQDVKNFLEMKSFQHGKKEEEKVKKEEDPLLNQIILYSLSKNKQDSLQSKQKSRSEAEQPPLRKKRVTITPEKLQLMNELFQQYVEKLQTDPTKPPSLKQLGKTLNLGYSTVLHKFRQFKATNRVRPGALINSKFLKRKYKKSFVVQDLLARCLQEKSFSTIVQIVKYIKQKYNQTYHRSLISRHLASMGYNHPVLFNKQKQMFQIKLMRKDFAIALQLITDNPNSEIYYLDEEVFKLKEYTRSENQAEMKDETQEQIHCIILASKKEIIKYELASSTIDEQRFSRFANEMKKYFQKHPENPKVLLLDLDQRLHYNKDLLKIRKQLIKHQLHMYFIPPNSSQMNLLQWFFIQIDQQLQQLQNHKFTNYQQFKSTIDQIIQSQGEQNLKKYYEISLNYMKLAIEQKNF